METAALKAFATSARTELIREVTARITAVLAQGSPERVESPTAVASLEKAVAAGGGGDKGKSHVADKVAYTWFNRIIALRFMDANGYTGIGVVSPAADQVGQPEALAAAKRGQIDREVVSNDRTVAAIAGLLNGTRHPRPGVDAQAEAYSLLLAAYCQFWNKTMPFMFERQGDFTELLIPANLLAGDSVLTRSVEVLTEDTCKDVEVIGWLYQFYISDRHDEVFAGFKKNKKAGANEIPAATQLFTPHWIVRYLVENSIGRLWLLNHPASRLVEQMEYHIAPDENPDFLQIAKPEELTVIDPACGSGHMLTYAFDLLYAIYEEEGYTPSEIPGLILTNNLFGAEIDPRAGALAAFALTMKARAKQRTFFSRPVEPNICVVEPISFLPHELDFLAARDGDRIEEEDAWNLFAEADTVGALVQPTLDATSRMALRLQAVAEEQDLFQADTIERAGRAVHQARCLSRKYAVVVANPPYMGSKNMTPRLAEYVKTAYPSAKQDLYGCFVLRAMALVRPNGFVAKVIGDTWMSISSFETLRNDILSGHSFDSFIHLRDVSNHPDIFGANAAFVLSMVDAPGRRTPFVRLSSLATEDKRQALLKAIADPTCGWRFSASSADFAKVPSRPIAYWLSDGLRSSFSIGKPLRDIAEPRKGMDTGDNGRFLRAWWEVPQCASSLNDFRAGSWVPYNKGGGFRRWYGYREFLVDWRDGGSQMRTRSGAKYFGREGWTWGTVTSGGFSIRHTPAGAAFDNGGCTLFSEGDLSAAALVLNSTTADAMLAAISPTLNFQPISIGAVPIVTTVAPASEAIAVVAALVARSRSDWDSFETSWDFEAPPWGSSADSVGSVTQVRLADRIAEWSLRWAAISHEQREQEEANNRLVARAYDLVDEVPVDVPLHRVSLTRNVEFQFGSGRTRSEYAALERTQVATEVVSYAVGCMFGRYSLDQPGVILGDQGSTLQDYLAKVSAPTFTPDADNVIPIVDGDWFEDDIVGRFRGFLRVMFGDRYFDENLNFVTESLGVKNLREYFITKVGKSRFYDDHVQRYKKRPIYWLFSSPNGSFNALIYLHRYAPTSVSTVLTYLREYVTKLESSLQQHERAGNTKEADRLRKILVELNEYEHYTLYPKASENVVIDLNDGVKANYPKLGGALRKIAGLESSGD
ncbi:restriction endonuclease [Mycobacterium sp. ST-F2]|uniref:BREX-1 system adenine-specific DNA-methyltransferase PglX n=1 Tax=Mycobacterium sp. ST-F2 TaxID=1490484 RepID=UPI00093C2571|nr:BREX-1 system adenine-specific DNA-methyltransferase PglX [Mycobacterium sp. ST-F2]OKH79003.1 restriction endonuclease [Mycobacterium sp. ST-F2]